MECEVHERECGGCTACCTVMSVSSIGKPAGEPCEHACDRGCAIYATRPEQCRSDFYCLWIRDQKGLLTEDHRPDRLGLVLTHLRDEASGDLGIAAREVTPGAADRPEARKVLTFLKQFVRIHVVPAANGDLSSITVEGKAIDAAQADGFIDDAGASERRNTRRSA